MRRWLAVLAVSLGVWAHEGLDEQIAAATRAIERDPGNGALYARRGELHRLHKDWPKAFADHAEAERRGGADLLGRARLEADCGRRREALATVERFLKGRPGVAAGLALRAELRAGLGDARGAGADWLTAAGVAGDPEYYLAAAKALAAVGDERGAVAAVDAGVARLGELAVLEQWAIGYLGERGRSGEALGRLEKMLARAERKETLLVQKGELLRAAGRGEEARAAFAAARAAWERLPARVRETRAMVALRARMND